MHFDFVTRFFLVVLYLIFRSRYFCGLRITYSGFITVVVYRDNFVPVVKKFQKKQDGGFTLKVIIMVVSTSKKKMVFFFANN